MFNEIYKNREGNVLADYMKGFLPPKKESEIHCHEEYEFLLIVSGEITYADNKGVIKMREKSLVFTKAHDVHNPWTSSERLYERYRIVFTKDAFCGLDFPDEIADLISASYKKSLSDDDFDELLVYFRELYEIMKEGGENKLLEKLYLISALSKGKRALHEEKENEYHYIKEIIEYIKINYKKRISYESLATMFFVSRGKLIYDFNAYAKMSILEYLTITRIEAAKGLLSRGYSVTAASEECGFSSPSYFIKVFSQITGITPLKFQVRFLQKTV
jgi:AraC-like DNA-binding protein